MSEKPSRFGRIARLGRLTSKVTTSYVGDRVKNAFASKETRQKAREKLHLDNAKELVDTVGKMKGAAMKLGQQMAQAANALDLPDEVAQTLSTLNKDAEPIAFDIIKEDIEAELGDTLDNLFASFDETPLGTASLGQAHLATLPDGTEVVVKVLHRGVEHSVDTDLMALKAILVSGRVLRRPKEEVDSTFEEIRARLKEELDYLQEAANIATFHEQWKDVEWVTIPRVHGRYCTERVLTMDRIKGVHVDEFMKTASHEARQKASLHLAQLYYTQVFRHRTLHADPHPGNYLFDEEGNIGLLDFGCVKRFDEFWIAGYARAARAILDQDKEAGLEACIDIGAWNGERPGDGDALWAFCEAIGGGLRAGEVCLGAPEEHLMEAVREATKEIMKRPRIVLPRHLVFLHRSLGGLYTMSRTIQGVHDYGVIVRPHVEYAIAKAEGRL